MTCSCWFVRSETGSTSLLYDRNFAPWGPHPRSISFPFRPALEVKDNENRGQDSWGTFLPVREEGSESDRPCSAPSAGGEASAPASVDVNGGTCCLHSAGSEPDPPALRSRRSGARSLAQPNHERPAPIPLAPLAVELGVVDLLPGAKVEFAIGDRDQHLVTDQQVLQMSVAVVLAGAMVPIVLAKGRQLLKPFRNVGNEAVFGVVDVDTGSDVHGGG